MVWKGEGSLAHAGTALVWEYKGFLAHFDEALYLEAQLDGRAGKGAKWGGDQYYGAKFGWLVGAQ